MDNGWWPWLQRIRSMYWPPSAIVRNQLFHPLVNPELSPVVEYKTPSRVTVLFCHGNTGNVQTFGPFMEWIAHETGMRVIGFDYPGYGSVAGPCSEQGCFDTVEDVYQRLSLQVSDENIVVWGFSMGCGPAIYIAARHPNVRALVLEAPFTSVVSCAPVAPALQDLLGFAAHITGLDSFANWTRAADVRCPVYMAHNRGDPTIPLAHSYYLAERFTSLRCLQVIEDAKHNIHPMKKVDFVNEIKKIL